MKVMITINQLLCEREKLSMKGLHEMEIDVDAERCPHCNSRDQKEFVMTKDEYAILCGVCGAQGPTQSTQIKALLDWNTRRKDC